MNSTDHSCSKALCAGHLSAHIGKPTGLVRCVFNGVTADEFDPVVPAADATDVVYVGEFSTSRELIF